MTQKTPSERLAEAIERTRRQWRLRIKAKAAPADAAAASFDETPGRAEVHTVADWFSRAHAALWTGLAKLEQALRPASGWRMW